MGYRCKQCKSTIIFKSNNEAEVHHSAETGPWSKGYPHRSQGECPIQPTATEGSLKANPNVEVF